MSMWEGHPILAEIRQGFKLRPTQTRDKSKPIIEAEGEEVPQIKYERKTPPPVLYFSQPKAQSKSICRVPQEALNIQHNKHRPISPQVLSTGPPRVPRPPSAPVKNTALLKLGGEIKDRSALLNSIKGGIKLRKAVTNDKSGLILDEEQKAIVAARSGTGTPGSSLSASQETLDSQGYSSLTPPSVHSAEDDESFNSRFSDSESESSYQPPPPPPIQKVNICLANAPPPPPPPPMAASTSSLLMPLSAPPPPPPMMPMSFSAPPPPPPPPPSSSSTSAAPFSRYTETQERSVAFESEKPWQPKPKEIIVKEEPKKPDAVFDEESLKVSKEKVEAEIKKGTAASRIAAFAKMAESSGGGAVFPKPLGPLIKNPPKRATDAAAATAKNEEDKVNSTKKAESKTSSSSKQLITKDEVKIHNSSAKDGKVESSKTLKDTTKTSSSNSSSKPSDKNSTDKTSDAKKPSSKSSSSSSQKTTGDSSDKSKSASSKTTSSSKDKPKTSSSSTTKTSESSKAPSATVHPPATKYSVPITVKTDSELPPPVPKSQPPKVSPSAGKQFKEPENNTNLGPYNYKGKSTPSPGSHSSISPNSGSYHTAIGSATSSYSSVPETRGANEKLSPVPSIASSSTSPRSTASGESSKENQSIESPFSSRFDRGVTQHSRNFEKIRQSFGAKGSTPATENSNNDANNNNGNSSSKTSDSVSSTLKKKDSTMASRNSPSKNTAVPINAPWYNKKDYPEDEKSSTKKSSAKDPETMNPEEIRGNYKFKIDLKKKHPIDIIQR